MIYIDEAGWCMDGFPFRKKGYWDGFPILWSKVRYPHFASKKWGLLVSWVGTDIALSKEKHCMSKTYFFPAKDPLTVLGFRIYPSLLAQPSHPTALMPNTQWRRRERAHSRMPSRPDSLGSCPCCRVLKGGKAVCWLFA